MRLRTRVATMPAIIPALMLAAAVLLGSALPSCAQDPPASAPGPVVQAEGPAKPETAPEAVKPAETTQPEAKAAETKASESKPAEAKAAETGAPAVKAPETATDTPPAPKPNPALEPPPVRKASAGPATKAATPAPGEKPYVIGATDVLYVRVWNNQNLTGMVDVRPDGMISLALIGEIKAEGLTVAELTDVLKAKLGEYLNNPEVDVQLTKPNSKKFFIIGEVGRPGEYPLIGRTTIMEALSSAGGFRETANQKKIYLLRGTVKHPFNYKDVIEGKHLDQDIAIENGDRIVVPQ